MILCSVYRIKDKNLKNSLFNSTYLKKNTTQATGDYLPNSTIVIKIAKVKEDFTKRGRKIMIGINFVKNDFTGKEARVGVLQHFKAAFLAMRTQVEEHTVIHNCKGQIYKGDFEEHSNS